MKKGLLLCLTFGLIVILAWGTWKYTRPVIIPPIPQVSMSKAPLTPPPLIKPAPFLSAGDFDRYHRARAAALQAHHELQVEYQNIIQDMAAQQGKLDKAMMKADPAARPAITKLTAIRAKNGVPPPPPPHPSAAETASGPTDPAATSLMTPTDWQEIRTAHAKAIKANPDLMADSRLFAVRMRAFEDKLDAVMLKQEPDLAPVLAKFGAGRHQPPPLSVHGK